MVDNATQRKHPAGGAMQWWRSSRSRIARIASALLVGLLFFSLQMLAGEAPRISLQGRAPYKTVQELFIDPPKILSSIVEIRQYLGGDSIETSHFFQRTGRGTNGFYFIQATNYSALSGLSKHQFFLGRSGDYCWRLNGVLAGDIQAALVIKTNVPRPWILGQIKDPEFRNWWFQEQVLMKPLILCFPADIADQVSFSEAGRFQIEGAISPGFRSKGAVVSQDLSALGKVTVAYTTSTPKWEADYLIEASISGDNKTGIPDILSNYRVKDGKRIIMQTAMILSASYTAIEPDASVFAPSALADLPEMGSGLLVGIEASNKVIITLTDAGQIGSDGHGMLGATGKVMLPLLLIASALILVVVIKFRRRGTTS